MLDADHTDMGKLFQAIGPAVANVLAEVGACSGNDQIADCSRTKVAIGINLMPVARGFDWFDQTPSARLNPPQPGPKVLFLNLHACHCIWNLSFYTFDIAKIAFLKFSSVIH